MQGAAGMWAQPRGYLPALQDLARRHGTLLICDEVATGFGRTGRLFAVEHEGITPDLLCLGKGITGGYLPLAATLASEAIFAAFLAPYERFEAFFHGHTYTGNPLACAVANANLDVFAAERVVERVGERATQLAGLLRESTGRLPCVGDVRQWGLMVGLELVRDAQARTPFEPGLRIGHRVVQAARRRGVMLRPLGNVIILMPPLSITATELDTLVRVTCESVEAAVDGMCTGAASV
ncbi:MAG: aminotransferase class III-fold pyridoxal phosphate-dependent enzyme [Candidatus Binatia bacterium]